jgi:hypothetical protein
MKLFNKKFKWALVYAVVAPCIGWTHTPSACCENKEQITSHTAVHAWVDEEQVKGFNPHPLHMVDQQQANFLFRGNSPESDGQFAYDQLRQEIKTYLANQRIPISDDFKIMDLSFLNYIVDNKLIEIEKKWFNEHPETGCYWLHSLFGSFINPVHLPKEIRDFTIKYYDIDGLKSLMQDIKRKLDTACPSNLVIYMHCRAGKDRTGEASACYLMEHKGYSYKDAVALDEKIAGRELRELSMNAIRWYAFYLRDIKHSHWIGDID